MKAMASRGVVVADRSLAALRAQADQVFRRSAGAPLIGGNAVRVLRDGRENYPAWEDAIQSARTSIHIEMYIIHRDAVGRRFVDLLAARARDGVRVRILYDWFGCGIGPALGLFRPLTDAGAEVIACNPPRLSAAFGWTWRNHRKFLSVDGTLTFIAGLCMGRMWAGEPAKGLEPWRDTGIEIRGPATAHGERAFAENWLAAGGTVDWAPPADDAVIAPAGSVNLRLIYTEPFSASMSWWRRWRGGGCGSPTRTSSATARTCTP
jgi:phosphatidylserine/phosphatidylglycerophosphate/cardiolipin synthase-like enzyme